MLIKNTVIPEGILYKYSRISATPVAPPLSNWALTKNKLTPREAIIHPIKIRIKSKIMCLLIEILRNIWNSLKL